jgi:hypothetical protein
MAKKVIRRISIEPAENGGHVVEHNYKPQPAHSSKNGMGMEYPESETHVFGPEQGHAMLAHVANHLEIPEGEEKPEHDKKNLEKIRSSENKFIDKEEAE